jgi:hypothetical protein
MTIPRFVVLSLLVLVSACAACGPATLPDDSERVQQGAECPEGCVVLTSSRDEMRCEADDPECCDWSDPTCADGGTGGGGTLVAAPFDVHVGNVTDADVTATVRVMVGPSVVYSGTISVAAHTSEVRLDAFRMLEGTDYVYEVTGIGPTATLYGEQGPKGSACMATAGDTSALLNYCQRLTYYPGF